VFFLGIILDLPSVWYLAALKYLIEAQFRILIVLLLLMSYALIVYAAIELPLISTIVWPKRTRAVVYAANIWVKSNACQLGASLAGVIGIWLLVRGMGHLS